MKNQNVKNSAVPVELIQNKIFLIRGRKVMFDKDLAELYAVTTGSLNRAVKRNLDRFPNDFMFQITIEELNTSRCQIGILKKGQNIKYLPYVFSEQGIAMLSSVLKSKRAIHVNIQIMRLFTALREMMVTHKELAAKLAEVENKVNKHDKEIQLVFETIRRLMSNPEPSDTYKRTKIGFIVKK